MRKIQENIELNARLFKIDHKFAFDIFIHSALSTVYNVFYPNPKDTQVLGLKEVPKNRNPHHNERLPIFAYFPEIFCHHCTEFAMENMNPETFSAVAKYGEDSTVGIFPVKFIHRKDDKRSTAIC